ncbi:10366_t:CDS:1, partial [Funneliformis caledonium]
NNDHYADFHTVYYNATTEDHRLTLMQAVKLAERAPNGLFVNIKVCDYIECFQCGKLRYIFSNQALNTNEKKELYSIKEEMNYSYSASLVEENHEFYTKVFVCEKITCEIPIELAYYSSILRRSNYNSQICYWCGVDGGFVDLPIDKTSKYKFVFPYCCWCLEKGKDFFL